MGFDNNLKYHVFTDYEINFNETKNAVSTVRLAQWLKDGEEPDINKAKIEIRKITMSKDGSQEIPLKGISIDGKESVDELTNGLVDKGFGNTKDIISSIIKRKDFKSTIDNFDKDPDDNDNNGELFDMRSLLLNLSDSDEE